MSTQDLPRFPNVRYSPNTRTGTNNRGPLGHFVLSVDTTLSATATLWPGKDGDPANLGEWTINTMTFRTREAISPKDDLNIPPRWLAICLEQALGAPGEVFS